MADMEKHNATQSGATEPVVEEGAAGEDIEKSSEKEKLDEQEKENVRKQEEHIRDKNHDAALALLQNPAAKYDDDHALCLVQVHCFVYTEYCSSNCLVMALHKICIEFSNVWLECRCLTSSLVCSSCTRNSSCTPRLCR